MAVISVLLLHVEPFLLSWGHQPLLVLYSCSQGFLLHGKSALSSDRVVRDKKNIWKNQVKYQIDTCVYKRHGNSYPWPPLPGDMAMCIFEVLARPRVGVCVPLAFFLCHGNGLFPSYVAQGGFKATRHNRKLPKHKLSQNAKNLQCLLKFGLIEDNVTVFQCPWNS